MADDDLDALFSPYVRKSQCWTQQHKYPRTLHNVQYVDWSRDPLQPGHNLYLHPIRSSEHPVPPLKRFRPLPALEPTHMTGEEENISRVVVLYYHEHYRDGDEHKLRMTLFQPLGRQTPPEALHMGYRKFSLDPKTKTLRKFDDPIPHPLHTVKRESYQRPGDRAHLMCAQNHQRYGMTPRVVASGIAPLVMTTPPPWSEDCLFEQQQQEKEQQQQQQQQQQ